MTPSTNSGESVEGGLPDQTRTLVSLESLWYSGDRSNVSLETHYLFTEHRFFDFFVGHPSTSMVAIWSSEVLKNGYYTNNVRKGYILW